MHADNLAVAILSSAVLFMFAVSAIFRTWYR